MIVLPITQEQKESAWKLSEAEIGKRKVSNGNRRQRYAGWLGEIILADRMGVERPVLKDEPDGGLDFIINGRICDLKSQTSKYAPRPHYKQNLIKSQTRSRTEYYIFDMINTTNKTMAIVGYLHKSELDEKWYHEAGTEATCANGDTFIRDMSAYEIPISELHPIENYENLFYKIK